MRHAIAGKQPTTIPLSEGRFVVERARDVSIDASS